MFQITDRAAQQLKVALEKTDNAENACFRVGVTDSQVQMVIDQERPGDTAIAYEGETLLVLDSAAESCLSNRQLDFEEQSSRLVLVEAE